MDSNRRYNKKKTPSLAINVAGALIFCLLSGSAVLAADATHRSDTLGDHTILIDGVHAHNYLRKSLEPNNYDYHSLFGSKDAFDYLRRHGFHPYEITDSKLDQGRLRNVDTLFINLVSDNLPPFFVEEILAIKTFVERGGNLLVITDHSNAYHHAHKLAPLFTELGIRVYSESALEVPPRTLGPGPGWIIIDHFRDHPITRDLSAISFHAGGTVDSDGAVALLSPNGWGDLWSTAPYGENSLAVGNRGNYGNFSFDKGERTGSLGVVLAREVGLGKVVVVGDQNALGNLWLRVADNYKLWINIFFWFDNRPAPVDYQSFMASERARVLILDQFAGSTFADYGPNGLYHAYAYLSRYVATYINEKVEHTYDLVVLSPSVKSLDDNQLVALRDHLSEGRNILILGKPQPASMTLLAYLEEGLTLKAKQKAANRLRLDYASQATVEIHYQVEQFNNQFINKPTQQPSQKEAARANELLARVRRLLP